MSCSSYNKDYLDLSPIIKITCLSKFANSVKDISLVVQINFIEGLLFKRVLFNCISYMNLVESQTECIIEQTIVSLWNELIAMAHIGPVIKIVHCGVPYSVTRNWTSGLYDVSCGGAIFYSYLNIFLLELG